MDAHTSAREILQAQILVELMSNSIQKELVLKGGLAMRASLGSERYTKDIDLDAITEASDERIQGIVRRSLSRVLQVSSVIERATITEPKQTSTTMRWKINGTVKASSRPLNLTVEVSRRPWAAPFETSDVEMAASFAVGATRGRLLALNSRALAVCKVLALTDPQRDAPRDLFDLNVLIDSGVEDPSEMLSLQPLSRLESGLDELWVKVESMSFERFSLEVKPNLPDEISAAVTRSIYEEMQIIVADNVEAWLTSASVLKTQGKAT